MPDTPNTADPEELRGRWFEFRLRTLLIGVALLAIPCGYLAREANIVRQRRAWLASHQNMLPRAFSASANVSYPPDIAGDPDQSLSFIRRQLGDELIDQLHSAKSEVSETSRLFPEASIYTGQTDSQEPWPDPPNH